MRTLVVFYSLSGTSRAVAEAIADDLSADIEEIRCGRYQPRFADFLKAGYDSWANTLPPIGAPEHAPSDYDLVVVGGPIWVWHAATPVRSYLRRESGKLGNVAFFLTHGGSSPDRVFREMQDLAKARPRATLAVRESDAKERTFASPVSSFTVALQRSLAA